VGIPELIRLCSRIETSGRVVVHPTIDKRHKDRRVTVPFKNGINPPVSTNQTIKPTTIPPYTYSVSWSEGSQPSMPGSPQSRHGFPLPHVSWHYLLKPKLMNFRKNQTKLAFLFFDKTA